MSQYDTALKGKAIVYAEESLPYPNRVKGSRNCKFFTADHSISKGERIDVPDLCTVMVYHSGIEHLSKTSKLL